MNHTSYSKRIAPTANQVEDFLCEIRYLEECYTDGLLTEAELEHAKAEVLAGRPVGLGFDYQRYSIPLD